MVGTFKTANTLFANQPAPTPWVRPTDWLAIPTPGTEEVIGLFGVMDNDANFVAVQAQGNYTVDWGDGTSSNHSSGTVAYYNYAFSAISSSTLTSKGYKQVLIRITPQAGQNLTVMNFSVNHLTPNKSIIVNWLDIDVNGPNITTLNIANTVVTARLKICERVKIRSLSPTITSLAGLFFLMGSLKSVDIAYSATSSVTNFTSMFNACYNIQEVPLFDMGNATNVTTMFNQCWSLTKLPLFDTGKVTLFNSMFNSCVALQSVPFFDTKSGQNFSSMFAGSGILTIPSFNMSGATTLASMFLGCSALVTVPGLNTQNNLTMNSTFLSCSSLTSIGLIDTNKVTDFISCFNGCSELITIPLIDTGKGINFTNMFNNCATLQTIPLIDTSKGTTFSTMFNGCSSLLYIPLINTISGTTFNQMFQACFSLMEIPLLDLRNGLNFQSMFLQCSSLASIPTFNVTKGTTFTTMFSTTQFKELPALNFSAGTIFTNILLNNTSIARNQSTGARFALAYNNQSLSQAAIVEIFTNLGTASGAQTITVSSNWGYAGLTAAERLIATSKGWTIA